MQILSHKPVKSRIFCFCFRYNFQIINFKCEISPKLTYIAVVSINSFNHFLCCQNEYELSDVLIFNYKQWRPIFFTWKMENILSILNFTRFNLEPQSKCFVYCFFCQLAHSLNTVKIKTKRSTIHTKKTTTKNM